MPGVSGPRLLYQVGLVFALILSLLSTVGFLGLTLARGHALKAFGPALSAACLVLSVWLAGRLIGIEWDRRLENQQAPQAEAQNPQRQDSAAYDL